MKVKQPSFSFFSKSQTLLKFMRPYVFHFSFLPFFQQLKAKMRHACTNCTVGITNLLRTCIHNIILEVRHNWMKILFKCHFKFQRTIGELIYTCKTFKLESRLGSNLTFFSGSFNLNIFPGSNLKISYQTKQDLQVTTWLQPEF